MGGDAAESAAGAAAAAAGTITDAAAEGQSQTWYFTEG